MWTDRMRWFCPPASSRAEGDRLTVITGEKGDFWRDTFYGFRHDNGHALLTPAGAEFTAEVTLRGDWQAQYDQAGLFLRASESHWIKAGLEFVNGAPWLAMVVTNGVSDWSQMPLPPGQGALGLRLTRVGDAVWLHYATEVGAGAQWTLFRLAPFPKGMAAEVGPMACSPSRGGLEVTFQAFQLGEPLSRKPY